MVAITMARLLLVWGLIGSYNRSLWLTASWLTVIVMVDLLDGIVGRRFSADGLARRAADATVDGLSILAAFAWLVPDRTGDFTLPILAFWCMLLVARGLYVGVCANALWRKHILVRGKGGHRLMNFDLALLLVLLVHGTSPAHVIDAVGGVAVLHWTLALDMRFRVWRQIRSWPQSQDGITTVTTRFWAPTPLEVTYPDGSKSFVEVPRE